MTVRALSFRHDLTTICLIALCIFQGLVIYHLSRIFTDVRTAEQVRFDVPDAPLPPAYAQILSSAPTINEFGVLARHVATLAHLAEQHVHESGEKNPELLEIAVQKLFPWWQSQTQRYYPWMSESLRSSVGQAGHKTGIIMSVGNKNVLNAAISISVLRHVIGSTLPIELAFIGEKDLEPRWRIFLERAAGHTNFYSVDLTQVYNNDLVGFQGWDTKPFALLASRFPQTILMDADALFFSRPDDYFEDHPALQDIGVLYFRDRVKWWMQPDDRRSWVGEQIAAAGRTPSYHLNSSSIWWQGYATEHQDSAVVMVDKQRPQQFIVLLFAAWMNAKASRDLTYSKFYGDKETYWLASELAGIPYQFESWAAARFTEDDSLDTVAGSPDAPGATNCTEHMVHADLNGTAPFFANDGVWRNKKTADGMVYPNWTDWYVGAPVDEAISNAMASMDFKEPAPHFQDNISSEEKKEFENKLMSSQVTWSGCKQRHREHWRPLSDSFKERVRAIQKIAEEVRTSYEKEIKAAL